MDLRNRGQRVADSYACNAKVCAVIVAGSVGRGRHDVHSDLEVDVYWSTPPTNEDRLGSIERTGGSLTTLWDYDTEDAEWSEDFMFEGTPITISNFTTTGIEALLGRQPVFRLADHLRLSAIHHGFVVSGYDMVRTWVARSLYTDEVRLATLQSALSSVPAIQWRQIPALESRGDLVTLRLVSDEMLLAILGLWFGLNRRYVEHPRFKWAHRAVASFKSLPLAAVERLRQACLADPATACDIALALLQDTLDIVEKNVPALETAELRQSLAAPRLPQ